MYSVYRNHLWCVTFIYKIINVSVKTCYAMIISFVIIYIHLQLSNILNTILISVPTFSNVNQKIHGDNGI